MAPPFAIQAPPAAIVAAQIADDGLTWKIDLLNPTPDWSIGDVRVEWRLTDAARNKPLVANLVSDSLPPRSTRTFLVDLVEAEPDLFSAQLWIGETISVSLEPGQSFSIEGYLSASLDLSGDGVVGPEDLAILLSLWSSGDPAGDLDLNGKIDSGDISMLLGGWGGS